MRIVKKKDGGLYMETDGNVERYWDDVGGKSIAIVHFPPLEELVKAMPSPLLEDIFAVVNLELQMRDTKWVEENL